MRLLIIALACSASLAVASAEDQVATTAAPYVAERAFPNLRLPRPVIFQHAGDGSDRIFIGTQYGTIHAFPNDQQVKETDVFLDIEDQVEYKDSENEEGLLGLAFHPNYDKNGEFFIYYTSSEVPNTSIISRFRVSADDPNRADPRSEQEIMRIEQPAWNHNGGTILFGPDGYLYIALGDGGGRNDQFENGQNLGAWLGSILRIDIDRQDAGKAYAVPDDNPFVDRKGARPEIWAYGLRNPWRIAFDSETGQLWAADVGQDAWEEIDLIVRGGNYGWSLREGKHPFGPDGVGPRPDLIEPIWEYHHDVGKSITGGSVYRGTRLPELVGCYFYADYVTGKHWALRYDPEQKKVVANYALEGFNNLPVVTYGTDEAGELYYATDVGLLFRYKKK